MQNTLLVLSELDARPFNARYGFEAAVTLKGLGTRRVDITLDPRHRHVEAHGPYPRPVTNFEKAANTLAESIFRPVLGEADAIYLDTLTNHRLIMPTIQQLSAAGAVCAQSVLTKGADHSIHRRDGQDLGLVFFLALHAKTSKGTPYDALIHASLSGATREALQKLSPFTLGETLDNFGTTIDLRAVRRILAKVHGADVITPTFNQRFVM